MGNEELPQVGRVAPHRLVLRGLQEGDRQLGEVDSQLGVMPAAG